MWCISISGIVPSLVHMYQKFSGQCSPSLQLRCSPSGELHPLKVLVFDTDRLTLSQMSEYITEMIPTETDAFVE